MSLVNAVDFSEAEHLIEALRPRDDRWKEGVGSWIFRGHANSDWALQPSAFRLNAAFDFGGAWTKGPYETHEDQVHAEARLLLTFLDIADLQGLPLPVRDASWADPHSLRLTISQAASGHEKWPFPEIAPLMALAQHHGIATRLLDWSRRAFAACYFAAREAAEHPGEDGTMSVWAFSPESARQLNRRGRQRFSVMRAAASSNRNLHAQSGLFTVTDILNPKATDPAIPDPLDRLLVAQADVFENDGIPVPIDIDTVLWEFRLPQEAAGRLLRLLAEEWVDGSHLFPGYEGAARALYERQYYS